MSSLTNLIPEDRQRRLIREYYVRLGVVASWMFAGLALAAAALLLPTYVFLSSSEHAKQTRLASVDSTLSSSDEAALSARLKALTSDASALLSLQNAPMATRILSEALAIPRGGVALTGFRYTPAASDPGTLVVVGTAATRDALRNYQLALQGASWSAKADLPVSAYAKDANIPFQITVTLKP